MILTSFGVIGLCLCLNQAHNRNVLSIDYNQATRVGKIYDDHRKFTLRVQYDEHGLPVLWTPSKYSEVKVSYTTTGLVSVIQRGNWSERRDYDNGRLVSRTWANGNTWSYTFMDKVRVYISDLYPDIYRVSNIFTILH